MAINRQIIIDVATTGTDLVVEGIKGITGAMEIAAGVTAALGVENENLEKTLVKVQSTMAIADGVEKVSNALKRNGAIVTTALAAATYVASTAQAAYAAVVGTTTGALKAFRIALVSTGIGAIVVGLGMLIANFESISKWVTDVTDKFGGLKNILINVSPIFNYIIKAMEKLGLIDDAETTKYKENAAAKAKADEDRLATLERQRKIKEDDYNADIARAEAEGKSIAKLQEQRRRDITANLKEQNELLQAKGLNSEEEKKQYQANQDEISKMLLEGQVNRAKIVKQGNDDANTAAEEAKAEKKKNHEELLTLEKQLGNDIKENLAKTDQEKLDLQKANEQELLNNLFNNGENTLKAQELLDEKYVNLQKDLNDKLSDVEKENEIKKLDETISINDKIVNDENSTLNQKILAYDNELAAYREMLLKKPELAAEINKQIIDLERNKQREINEQNKTTLEKTLNGDAITYNSKKDAIDKLREINQKNFDDNVYGEFGLIKFNETEAALDETQKEKKSEYYAAINAIAQESLSAISDIISAGYQFEINSLDKKTSANEKARKQELAGVKGNKQKEDEINKKYDEANAALAAKKAKLEHDQAVSEKAINVIKAVINTALAITAALTTGGPAGYVMAALSAAVGVAQIATILATKIPDGDSVTAPSGVGTSLGGAAASAQSPSFNVVGTSSTNQLAQTIGQEQAPVKAYVVSNEVTTAQALDRNRVSGATFGK